MSSESTTSSRGYTKIKDIGSGSYGTAVLVQDKENKLYVMKIIDMSRMDPKQRKDAINEVRVLSSLKHPYIVSYRESYMSEGRNLAIVMDYADGGDLHQRIQRTRQAGKVFSEERIVRWLTEATLALKYLHDKHVLHRDLKSQNLFLTAQDRLRIGDFGISRVLDCTAAFAKTTIGTPYYLSPEICLEKPYTFSSDIWALGCVLYELACLRVPFDATSLQSLVQKITRGPTPVIPNSYSQELRQLGGDLLHREQTQRPSAQEILQRPLVQHEIRRMLREEQAKGRAAPPDAGGPGLEVKKSPSVQSEARREHTEGDDGGLSSRHWQQNPALKGVGASVCMEGGHVRDPSPQRQMPRQWDPAQGAPRHVTGARGRRP
mmetsp:Transcript_33803/g.78159  ORF Transcript_33803/g.78159 Transcript_33803/m.78159 type:complete len:376 (+) Transcript_33803:99-1226(+)